jgi:hypothetical protein
MLILFDLPKNVIHAFNTYGTLYNHLENLERKRGKGKWVFALHSHQRMMSYYRYIRDRKAYLQSAATFEEGLEEALKQAVAGKLIPKRAKNQEKSEDGENSDILEIINGNVKKPVFIRVTPDVDVGSLQQKWCQNYCKAHGYRLFEVSSPADFKAAAGGQDAYAAG